MTREVRLEAGAGLKLLDRAYRGLLARQFLISRETFSLFLAEYSLPGVLVWAFNTGRRLGTLDKARWEGTWRYYTELACIADSARNRRIEDWAAWGLLFDTEHRTEPGGSAVPVGVFGARLGRSC